MTRAGRILALLAGLAGCATGFYVTASDGQPAVEIRCRREQWRCAEKAERFCRQGYVVLDNGVRTHTMVMANGVRQTMQPVFEGYIVIRCR